METAPDQAVARDGGRVHQLVVLPPADVSDGMTWLVGAHLVVDGNSYRSSDVRVRLIKA